MTATDPSGDDAGEDSDTIIVTITALDRNDAPTVTGDRELAINERPGPWGRRCKTRRTDTNVYMWMDEDFVDSPTVDLGRPRLRGVPSSAAEAQVPDVSQEERRRLYFKRDMEPDYEDRQPTRTVITSTK